MTGPNPCTRIRLKFRRLCCTRRGSTRRGSSPPASTRRPSPATSVAPGGWRSAAMTAQAAHGSPPPRAVSQPADTSLPWSTASGRRFTGSRSSPLRPLLRTGLPWPARRCTAPTHRQRRTDHLHGGHTSPTGGRSRETRRRSTRPAWMRSCSRASRVWARTSAAVGRFWSRARGQSPAYRTAAISAE